MTAGKINEEWLANVQRNESPDNTVEIWFGSILNCVVDIDDDRFVWAANHWLDQDRINYVCGQIG